MSESVKFNPGDLKMLGSALDRLSRITRDTGVRFDAYGSMTVEVRGHGHVRVSWSEEDACYRLDDQVGS